MNNMMDELNKIRGVLDDLGGIAPQKGSNNYRWYSLPKGTEEVKLRILPHWNNPNSFPAKMVIKHYQIPNSDKSFASSANCLKTFGMDCPICNVCKKYEQQFEGVSKHRPVVSLYFNMLILQGPPIFDKNTNQEYMPDPNVPHIVGMRESFYSFLQGVLEKPESAMVLDPMQGADIYIQRKRAKGAFDYRLAFGQRPIANDTDSLNNIMSQTFDLDEIWKSPDDDAVRSLNERANLLSQQIEGKILSNSNPNSGSQNYQQSYGNYNNQGQNQGNYQNQGQPQNHAHTVDQYQNYQTINQSTHGHQGGGYAQPASHSNQQQPEQTQPNSMSQAEGIMGNDPEAQRANNFGVDNPPTNDNTLAGPSSSQQSKGNVPPGAPKCFGDPEIHNPSSQQCIDCKYELHCLKAAGKEPGY